MPTLYISGRETSARLDDRRVVVSWKREEGQKPEKTSVPLFGVERVVVLGTPAVTMPLLAAFLDNGIPVFFLTSRGRWRGSLMPNCNGNAARRLRQYKAAGVDSLKLAVAKGLVKAKIRNMRRVLQRLAANRRLSPEKRSSWRHAALLNSSEVCWRTLPRLTDCGDTREPQRRPISDAWQPSFPKTSPSREEAGGRRRMRRMH